MNRLNRLFDDEEAVSEVVGTILTLGITVVLFSSVFAAVTHLDSPDRGDHNEFTADYFREEEDIVTITLQSGSSLETDDIEFTFIYEGDDGTTEDRYRFGEIYPDVDLSIEGGEDTWSIGEVITIEGELFEEGDTDIELAIHDLDRSRVVYRTELSEEVPGSPDFRKAYIRYIHDWRDYAEQGEGVEIVAELENIDDVEDIDVHLPVNDDQLWDEYDSGEEISLDPGSGNRYSSGDVNVSSDADEKSYNLRVVAEIGEGSVEEWVRLNVGKRPAERHPKELEIGRIEYDERSPSHGDDLELTAEVYNHGRGNVSVDWTMLDEYKEDERIVAQDEGVKIEHGPAPTEITGEFEILGSGHHEIEIDVEPSEDEEYEGANETIELVVDPNVLLVEDRSARRLPDAELMSNSLSGLNLDYHEEVLETDEDVTGSDEVEDDGIEFEEYSIVVWIAGNETENDESTLLEDGEVASELIDYLEYDPEDEEDIPGNLWLLGVNLDHIHDSLDGYLGSPDLTGEVSDPTEVRGVDEDGPFFREPTFELSPVDYDDGQEQINFHEMNMIGDEEDNLVKVENDEDQGRYFGGGYEYEDFDHDQRTVTNPFIFDSIQDPGLRTNFAGEVIGWATNITVRSGVDVAVTQQNIEPTAPMYEDDIEITATFRNNGPEDINLANTAMLVRNGGEEIIEPPTEADLYLEANGGTSTVTFEWTASELGVHELLVKADYYGYIDQANPETNDITYKNLDISEDEIFANVHYSTLVVDADLHEYENYHNTTADVVDSLEALGYLEGSDWERYEVETENDGTLANGPDYQEMSDYNSVFWITGERSHFDEDPDIFTEDDLSNILRYLKQSSGGNMLFMGEYMLEFLDQTDHDYADDVIDMMGMKEDANFQRSTTDALIGQENNLVGHGLKYELEEGNSYTTFTDTNEYGEVLFKGTNGQNFASTHDDGNAKTIYMGANLERIEAPLGNFDDWPAGDVHTTAENASAEFIYTSLWSFGKQSEDLDEEGQVDIEGRSELRVTDYDIKLTTDRPHTGRSYEVRATIENIGYRGASTIVRFHDGEDYIGAENLFVEGSERTSDDGSSYFEVEPGTATAEVSWSPSEPGIRDLIVRVDPEREVDEIVNDTAGDGPAEGSENKMMEFNNRAEIEKPVYFFYDDMEEGEDNWRHDETLVNIDGTGPLDFADREDMDTDVEGDWDHDLSGMTYEDGSSVSGDGYYETDDEDVEDFTDKASYSNPRSYWMPETPAAAEEREPIDMVMVIDNSASMKNDGRDWWEHARDAAISVVEMLEEGDRVAIYGFGGDGGSFEDHPVQYLGLDGGYCPGEDEDYIIDNIIEDNFGDPDEDFIYGTPLFDTTAAAISHMDGTDGGEGVREEAVAGAIMMTDGASNADEGYWLYEPGEGGEYQTGSSEVATPGIANDYVEGEESGQLGVPYNVMTVTLGDVNKDARIHQISATAGGPSSFGIFEENADNLPPIFEMYVSTLVVESRGGIRSIPSESPMGESLYSDNTVTTDFTVFSDGFLGGGLDISGYDVDLEEWETVEPYENWNVHDGVGFWEGYESGGSYNYHWWEQTAKRSAVMDSNEEWIETTIEPSKTLDDLPGNFVVENVKVNYHLYTPSSWGNHAELDLIVDGQHVATEWDTSEEVDGDYRYSGGTRVNTITSATGTSTNSFDIRFEHSGDDGRPLSLSDVNVKYELEYTPPEGGAFTPDGYPITEIDTPQYRYTTTPEINVEDTTAEELRFRNKHWMTEGTNGGIMYLWGEDENGEWSWEEDNRKYIRPDQSYTGNLDFDVVDEEAETGGPDIDGSGPTGLIDTDGEKPYWAFNGKSAGGTFGWRYTSVDLAGYEDFMENHSEVRVVFVTAQLGGITDDWEPEMGWYLDNVNLRVTREFNDEVPDNDHGYWMRVSQDDLEGIGFDDDTVQEHIDAGYYDDHTPGEDGDGHFWMFADNSGGEPTLPKGVDSSLYTSRIDLSNAELPELHANMKFNLDNRSGVPPDGMRIEISEDDGRTWDSLTYGIRSGWGVSGHDVWGDYSGDYEHDNYGWVNTTNLQRVNADLSGWRGEHVIIRFRVFTNTTESYEDELDGYEDEDYPRAIMIDDVVVKEADMEDDGLDAVSSDRTLESSSEELYEQEDTTSPSYASIERKNIAVVSQHSDRPSTDRRSSLSGIRRNVLLPTRNFYDFKERDLCMSKVV